MIATVCGNSKIYHLSKVREYCINNEAREFIYPHLQLLDHTFVFVGFTHRYNDLSLFQTPTLNNLFVKLGSLLLGICVLNMVRSSRDIKFHPLQLRPV